MSEFEFNSSIQSAKPDTLFAQTITLQASDRAVGKISWSVVPGDQGVVQILELWVDPAVRRRGNARRLMAELTHQARSLCKLRKVKLRRMWIGVGHKTRVVGRSFLTNEGFHHVGSTGGLLKDEDMLIYVKSLD